MTREDLVLFRRMRGIFWGLLVVGIVLLPNLLVLSIAIPGQLGVLPDHFLRDNGEPTHLARFGFALAGVLGSIGAVVLGATAGSVDHQRGVLRDLVLAGRPRWRIVVGRLVAASVLLLGSLAVSYGITILVALLLAPVDVAPDWEHLVREAVQYLPGIAHTLPFAAGLAMLVGSRGPAIAVYFGVALIIDNVLAVIPRLGELWQRVSLSRADGQVNAWVRDEAFATFERPTWHAVLVLVGWATIPFVAGIARLARRDL